MKKLLEPVVFKFFTFERLVDSKVRFFSSRVAAGFPSPAEDYMEEKIDLNQYLVPKPLSTFLIRVKGNSMEGARIFDGALLVIDKSKTPVNNSICLCILNGEFTVKRIRKVKSTIILVPENPLFKEIEVLDGMDFEVWGVVIKVINDPV